ncbi:uncharacterized protein [Paramisgurnus dabryanus]|uniref:uncharacterized protein n=1 Tax=Paramisgurnus dabryanus TaxID=90735 RepID=UPI0031F40AB2
MRITQLHIYLLVWLQAAETLDQLTDLGQNVSINCDLDREEIYWLLLKTADPPMMILRTLSSKPLFFNKTFRHKYSLQSKNHLFINNITIDELGVYYCMKKDTPPKFSSGTRLHVKEPTESPNQETCIQQTDTVVKYIEQNENRVTPWQILTIILGLLNGVLLIVIIGLLKVFIVGSKRFEDCSQQLHDTELQQVTYRCLSASHKPVTVYRSELFKAA